MKNWRNFLNKHQKEDKKEYIGVAETLQKRVENEKESLEKLSTKESILLLFLSNSTKLEIELIFQNLEKLNETADRPFQIHSFPE